ncbi:MAG: hypothetical protein HRU77_04225 [Gammaproteobacteria bacterium]|nr:MAG: hypothetical protein HRU77_04225 [Gammaproteobacteria bacterium]
MSEDFKWTDDDSVCISKVNAVAVYVNVRNEVVIRQQDDLGDDDQLIIIPLEHVDALIFKLKQVVKELKESLEEPSE